MRISDWSSDVCSSDLAASSSRIRRGVSRKTSSYVKQTGLIGTRLSFPPLFKIYTRQEAIRVGRLRPRATHRKRPRSEEHTSELRSLMRSSYAVFCLKKKIYYINEMNNSCINTQTTPAYTMTYIIYLNQNTTSTSTPA